jgi:hypothetical protein
MSHLAVTHLDGAAGYTAEATIIHPTSGPPWIGDDARTTTVATIKSGTNAITAPTPEGGDCGRSIRQTTTAHATCAATRPANDP